MKKTKQVIWFALVPVFLLLVSFTFVTNDNTNLARINIITQALYTLVTAILVLLTYAALVATQTQKHQSVRPYIGLVMYDLIDDERQTFDFRYHNEGNGLALNINIKVINLKNNDEIFECSFTRRNIEEKIDDMADDSNYLEIKLLGNIEDYYGLKVVFTYEDIYGKKYKSEFDLQYNPQEREFDRCIESFEEL
jgi:hypothetical protein